MTSDWETFLADDSFLLPQWSEESDYDPSQLPISTQATTGYDYPYNLTPYQSQYTNTLLEPDAAAVPQPSSTRKHMMSTPVPIARDVEQATDLAGPDTDGSSKRTKNNADTLTACWTSPLCPSHTPGASTPPDVSTCGAACAPFLFAGPQDSLATALDEAFLAEQQIRIDHDVSDTRPEMPSPTAIHKRSESDSDDHTNPPPSTTGTTTKPPHQQHDSPSLGDDTSPDASHDTTAKPRQRQPHNQVERKYRESLNTQLEALRKCVPSLKPSQTAPNGQTLPGTSDIEDLAAPSKPSKAVVLASATAYIRQMEKERKQLQDENRTLQARVSTLQALVKCEDCTVMQYVVNLTLSGKQ